MFILRSHKTGLCEKRPSGFASLPDCFFLSRFAIWDDGAAAPYPAWGAAPNPARDFAP